LRFHNIAYGKYEAAPQMDEGIIPSVDSYKVTTVDVLTHANFYLWGHLKKIYVQ
jgi:hypothetical protein